MAQQEDDKVKVVYHNDPKKFRFVTKQAASYLSPKWVVSEDQAGAPSSNGQKKAVAAPVESTIDKKAELREKYNELTGEAAKPEWNEARLFVEIQKATVKASAPKVETETASSGGGTTINVDLTEEVKVEEAVKATPKKKGPNKRTLKFQYEDKRLPIQDSPSNSVCR